MNCSDIQYRRPEFYSSINQCVCVDNSTYETVLCKSVQAFVKAGIFLLRVKISRLHFKKDSLLNIGAMGILFAHLCCEDQAVKNFDPECILLYFSALNCYST